MRIHPATYLSALILLGGTHAPVRQQPQHPKWPGIVRVGEVKVAKDWKDLSRLPGVHRWECDAPSKVCWIQFDPQIWTRATYDQKRDITAMFGMALAYGRKATITVVVDMMTGKDLATYDAESDKVRIK
ncbi:MAG TPA: hypothetical protein VGQ17_02835 [Gemmatimonadales bacterium]|nr:hypothetical protein [Gemmatimonadales bacterium]